jgi:futalosine hydrolase
LRTFSGRKHVEVLVSGVGPVEAGLATTRALAQSRYSLVINAGIAGAFSSRAAIGDAVAVARERYVDLGREDRAPIALPDGASLVDAASSDDRFLQPFRDGRLSAIAGDGITSATATTTDERARELDAAFAATVESMEGFAVLRAAELAGVPAIELRGISNIVGARRPGGWNFDAGATAAVRTLENLLDAFDPATL